MRTLRPKSGTSMLRFALFAILGAVTAQTSLPPLHPKQADVTKVVVKPINVAPSQYWDGNDGPWSTFPLQVGSSSQLIRVVPSTASYNTWAVAPQGCPSFYPASCPNDRGGLYNANRSASWVPYSSLPLGQEIALGYNTTASFGLDQVTLGWRGSGGPSINDTVVAYYYDASEYFLGTFGLNPCSTNFSDGRGPHQSYLSTLKSNNLIPSLSYGYTAGNRYRLNQVYGSLTLGGYDDARITSKNVSFPMVSDPSRDLLVNIRRVQLATHGTVQADYDKAFQAVIDSTVPYLYLPLDLCQMFEQTFGLIYNSTLNLYLVNATLHSSLILANPSVNLVLQNTDPGGRTISFSLPYNAFDLTMTYPALGYVGQSSSYFPIRRGANETQYVLGRAFLQEAYLIVDYERRNFTLSPCSWDADIVNTNLVTIFSMETINAIRSNRHARIAGRAISGIVIGVIAGLALIGLAIFLFLRKRNRKLRAGWEQQVFKHEGPASAPPGHPAAIELASHRDAYELGHDPGPNPFASPHELDGRERSADVKELPAAYWPYDHKERGGETHELQGSNYGLYELDATPMTEPSASDEPTNQLHLTTSAHESQLVSPVTPESDATTPPFPAMVHGRDRSG